MSIRNFDGNVNARYLREMAKLLQDIKDMSYEMMNLSKDSMVLDIGYGTGIDVHNIARLVGKEGKVVGLDNDENMIEEAKNSYREPNLEFICGDVEEIPYPDEYFDAVRAERLFQVLSQKFDMDDVLQEMIRVTKKDGMIVLLDTDWGSASVDYENHALTNRLLHFFAEVCRPKGFAGREFLGLLKRNGIFLMTIKVEPVVTLDFQETPFGPWLTKEALEHKIATENELDVWNQDLTKKTEGQEFYSCVNMVLVAGKK